MNPLPDPEYPSETIRRVTIYLAPPHEIGNDEISKAIIRFPMREMDLPRLAQSIGGNSTLTVDFHNRTVVIPYRSIVLVEMSKEEYGFESDDDELAAGAKFISFEA